MQRDQRALRQKTVMPEGRGLRASADAELFLRIYVYTKGKAIDCRASPGVTPGLVKSHTDLQYLRPD
jgi:hypothetical protein